MPNTGPRCSNPTAFQQLKERVDIEFPATNPPFLQPGEAAQFDVIVKNTPKLIVKIYELNALNFFLTQKRQLNTDLNLDGLVANSEQTHDFDTGPFKRTRQTFKFPELKGKRGAWIIEFIGTGRSSRALAARRPMAGDPANRPVRRPVDWCSTRNPNRSRTPWCGSTAASSRVTRSSDRIVVPFTNQPGMRQFVVSDPAGTFATLTQFEHHAEEYRLDAQFHIEREQLLARRDATLAVRTSLMLGESPARSGLAHRAETDRHLDHPRRHLHHPRSQESQTQRGQRADAHDQRARTAWRN